MHDLIDEVMLMICGIKKNDEPFSASDQLRLEVGLDSISFLELIIRIEERFRISIMPSDYPKIVTIEDLVVLIAEEQDKKQLDRS